ncbi:MAG: CinA family protein, partial [Saprospiraceae bacterium]|nr:CinA family protein [Saprospiraceae bacterium]
MLETQVARLQALLPDLIYGYEAESLEEAVGRILRERGLRLATAESCTGGYLAHRITS